jgi:hypothetical protein
LLYASPNLLEYAEQPDQAHPWGPFLSPSAFDSLERLVLLYRDELPEADRLLLKHPPEEIKAALEACLHSLGVDDLTTLRPTDLLRAAKRLTRRPELRCPDTSPRREPEPDVATADSDPDEPEETPSEAIHRKLLRSLRRLHQAHWLCWLTESRVSWSLPDGRFRYLELRHGAIAGRGYAPAPKPGSFVRPPRPLRERQAALDLATYERLRILATELSILSRRGARVAVELSLGRFIDDKSFTALRGEA